MQQVGRWVIPNKGGRGRDLGGGDYGRECWRRHVWRRAIAHVRDLEGVGEWARNQQKYETKETVATDWHEHLHTCHLHQQSQTWRNRLKKWSCRELVKMERVDRAPGVYFRISVKASTALHRMVLHSRPIKRRIVECKSQWTTRKYLNWSKISFWI